MAAIVEGDRPVAGVGEGLHPARRDPVGEMVRSKAVNEQHRIAGTFVRRPVDEGEIEALMREKLHLVLAGTIPEPALPARAPG